MRVLRPLAHWASVLGLVYFGTLGAMPWAANLLCFYSAVLLVGHVMLLFLAGVARWACERLGKTIKAPSSAGMLSAETACNLYILVSCWLAATAHYWLATAWLLAAAAYAMQVSAQEQVQAAEARAAAELAEQRRLISEDCERTIGTMLRDNKGGLRDQVRNCAEQTLRRWPADPLAPDQERT